MTSTQRSGVTSSYGVQRATTASGSGTDARIWVMRLGRERGIVVGRDAGVRCPFPTTFALSGLTHRDRTIMRHFATTSLAGVALGTSLALTATPAVGATAIHVEEDVAGDVFVCETTTYTVTSGTLKAVFHEGESASGNVNFTGTLTPQHVTLVDEEGNSYRLAGAVWFGATGNAQQETGQQTFTTYLNILAAGGGVVDRVAQTGHFDFEGDGFLFDKGTCVVPE